MDKLENGTLTMEYFPTDEIMFDFFTKPLQVTLFEILKEFIMGWDHISLSKTNSMSEFKERVGNDRNEIFNPKMDSSTNRTWTYDDAVTGD